MINKNELTTILLKVLNHCELELQSDYTRDNGPCRIKTPEELVKVLQQKELSYIDICEGEVALYEDRLAVTIDGELFEFYHCNPDRDFNLIKFFLV